MKIVEYLPSLLRELDGDSIKFVNLMDSVNYEKRKVISDSLRTYTTPALTQKKWALKKLSDYGLTLPWEFPFPIILQTLLNIDTLFRLRGSKQGIQLFCSLLTLGEVYVDASNFYSDSSCLLLGSTLNGYLPTNLEDKMYLLPSGTDTLESPSNINISISSSYFSLENNPIYGIHIKEFINSRIREFIPFSNGEINIYYSSRFGVYFHPLLNKRFVDYMDVITGETFDETFNETFG